MKRSIRSSPKFARVVAAGAMAVLLAACGRAAGAASGDGSTLSVSSRSVPGLGAVLVTGSGMTLYYRPGETTSKITCTGSCATEWPPFVLPSGDTKAAGAGGVSGTFGTFSMPNGDMQVTFDGHPLYTFVRDKAPGDATGQNVENFLVASPSGAGASGSPSGGGRGYGYGNGGY
jgi:predicted lipoprotein with Yx(FWY)xxD motif